MNLTPSQGTIAKDTHRFRVVNAGRRFGKTILAVEEMLGFAVYKEDARVVYIAPTFQAARDIAWDYLKARTKDIATSVNESRLEVVVPNTKGGTSKIMLRGWESVETLRGQKFHFIVIDEVAMVRRFWIQWQEVLRPTLTDTKGHVLFISTPKGFNHFYDLYNLEKDKEVNAKEEWQSFHFTTYDNPHLDREEIEAAKQSVTEDRFAQEYLGDFRKVEGLVYPEFSRETHLFDDKTQRPGVADKIVGIDWGYTNPAAVLNVEMDSDGTFWVMSEWYEKQKTTEEIANVTGIFSPNYVYPDHAEPDRIETLKQKGFNVMQVSKDVKAGIDTVRTMFKQNRLKIHKDCINLINELETYHYREVNGTSTEEPEKEKDHAVDALRYIVHNHLGGRPFLNKHDNFEELFIRKAFD